MNRKIVLLPGMKFMSGGVLYRAGDALPDTEETRNLVRKRKAVYEGIPDEEVSDDEPVTGKADGYEKLKVKDLVDLAKAREIDIPGGAVKAQIIELLRVWDAENEGDS